MGRPNMNVRILAAILIFSASVASSLAGTCDIDLKNKNWAIQYKLLDSPDIDAYWFNEKTIKKQCISRYKMTEAVAKLYDVVQTLLYCVDDRDTVKKTVDDLKESRLQSDVLGEATAKCSAYGLNFEKFKR